MAQFWERSCSDQGSSDRDIPSSDQGSDHEEVGTYMGSEEETDTLPDEASIPVTKVTDGTRKKYVCMYKREYSTRYPWATESKKGKTYAYCMPCARDVCLGQGGTKDLTKHEQTNLHIKSQQGFSGIRPLHSYFGPIRKESVISAEIKFFIFFRRASFTFIDSRSLQSVIFIYVPRFFHCKGL